MRPIFKLSANKKDISDLLEGHLLSMTVTDELGLVSDSITIELDDEGEVFEVPARGAEIEAFLGYEEDVLYTMGTFVVDEVELSSPPNKLTITGRASNSNFGGDLGAFKAPKSYSWEQYTLWGILQTIARRYKLTDSVDKRFKTILVDHIDQTDESDASFLLRLAKDYGASVKIAGGKLLFIEPSRGYLPDGTPLPLIRIDPKEISSYRMRITERGLYSKVIAKYYDFEEGEEKKVTVGTGEPTFSLRDTFTSRNQALLRAKGKLEDIKRGQFALSLELIGNPLISAETRIEISVVREEIFGEWVVKQVRHTLNSSGYTTSLEATRPIIKEG